MWDLSQTDSLLYVGSPILRCMKKIRRPGLKKLIAACPHMRRIYDLGGYPPPRDREAGFPALLRIIVDQQVSTHSGAAIWRRLEDGIGEVTPASVLAAGDGGLRACGFSGAKARYALGLAQAIVAGELDLESLRGQPNQVVQQELTKIKGIGRWTSDIYLMFALGRADVWPAGDLAVVIATQHLLGLSERPTQDEMDAISERWRPWRTTAAIMLWHYYRHIKSGTGGEPGRG